jgi:phage terminase large subunit-like protein
MDVVTDYARDVVEGRIVAGPWVRAACKRHLDDLANGAERGLSWDLAAAQRVINFFADVLTVEIDGKVRPFVLRPWQAFIIGSLFGWMAAVAKEDENGEPTGETVILRRFRRAFVEIAKGSGKSPMAAGIGHYMLSGLRKVRAEVYSAAAALDQAEVLFRDAVSMWERSPALRRRVDAHGEKKIKQLSNYTGGFFKPISAEKKGKSGPRPFCVLIDEVHEHPDNTVIEMMRAGTKGNQDALIFEITNSGFDKRSVCGQEHDYSIEVVTGQSPNDQWFTYIAALDDNEDPFLDEACWPKANPNLGASIHYPYIREQVEEAKGMPSKEGTVRRLNFCQWTESASAAIPRDLWVKCQRKVDVDVLREAGYRCFGGLDLSRTRDLTAYTNTWLKEDIKDQWRFVAKTWFWTPAATLAARAKQDRAPYDLWVKQEHMEAVPGPRIKFSWLAPALVQLVRRFEPEQIGCDQYGLEQLQEALDAIGESIPAVVHPQGFNRRKIGEREDVAEGEETGAEDIVLWMPDSINKLEAALLEERIEVDDNPVMTMCASGVVYQENRTGHRMFAKDKATSRIDGMVSLAMSVGVATVHPPTPDTFGADYQMPVWA